MRWLFLFLLLVPAGCARKESEPVRAAGKPAAPVVVAPVQQRTIPVNVNAIGNVEPYSTIQVRAEVGGQLQKVYFSEGEMVTKGQLLFQIDARPQQETIRQLEANLAKDSAQAQNARADAARYGELNKQGIVARQQYEQIASNAAALEAGLAADRAAIENARLQMQYATVHSPIDGKTGILMVKEGNLVKANDVPLVTINQIHPIYVTFSVPEVELPEIRRRFQADLRVEASRQDSPTAPSAGKLTFIDNAVDHTTGTIKLKATFSNNDNALWPGQFVNVLLKVSQQSNAIVIPAQAVQAGQKGPYVYVVGGDGKAQYRGVEVGRTAGGDLAVTAGLNPGESVVIDGQSRIVPGAPVQVVKKP